MGRGVWDKAGIYMFRPVIFADNRLMHLQFRFDMFVPARTSSDQMYVRISVGPISSIDGSNGMLVDRNGLHLEFHRYGNSRLVTNLKSHHNVGRKQSLVCWKDAISYSDPNWSWMATVALSFNKDENWSF